MVKFYKISQIHKLKSTFYKEKLQFYKGKISLNIKTNGRGRPKKQVFSAKFNYKLSDIFQEPGILQANELFSEISKLILNFIGEGKNKELKNERYKEWFDLSGCFPNRFNENYNIKNKFNDHKRQKLYEFMSTVVLRTRDSLGLNREISDILYNINESFSGMPEGICEENVKNEIISHYYKNNESTKNNKINRFFNREMLEKYIKILFLWKKVFIKDYQKEYEEFT